MNLRATDHPEFDAWRWSEYWAPADAVVEFKREVYQLALTELARYLPRANPYNRFLRSSMRAQRRDEFDVAADPAAAATAPPLPDDPARS